MPQVDLSTGVSLYYETHGRGDPLVLIPSTGFSAEAWKPSQMPLAKSLQLIIHDPRGCGRSIATQQVYTINQMANDRSRYWIISALSTRTLSVIPWADGSPWN